jgi:dUTP pyrophosphatase
MEEVDKIIGSTVRFESENKYTEITLLSKINVKVEGGEPPQYMSAGASGADLKAASDFEVQPGKCTLVKTGLKLAIPMGYEAQVRPRSGLALKHRITVLNAPGTIDSDYRGEVGVILFNAGDEVYKGKAGDRIAQLVFAQVSTAVWQEVDSIEETERGSGGFGSTGK